MHRKSARAVNQNVLMSMHVVQEIFARLNFIITCRYLILGSHVPDNFDKTSLKHAHKKISTTEAHACFEAFLEMSQDSYIVVGHDGMPSSQEMQKEMLLRN